MIIAKRGKYSLRTKTYLDKHEYTTKDIEVCCDLEDEDHCYTIADFTCDGNGFVYLHCLGDRLLQDIESSEDVYKLKQIISLGLNIMKCEEVNSNYEPCKCESCFEDYNSSGWEFK